MSNYLAIATVTAALQRLLQEGIQEDVSGAVVTTVRPDNPAAMNQSRGINIYLYQATPNPAWRNADLRTRRPKGDLIKHGQAALDLHYLLTFYGNEQALEPQRLLGSAIRTLVDRPTLTQEMIQETVSSSRSSYLSFLTDSTLDDQMQLVQFIPSTITTEDLSRIWSVFFQIPYSLSFAFQGTAVMIQGKEPGKTALPVRKRQFYTTSARPVIDKVGLKSPIERNGKLENLEAQSWETEPLTRSSNLVLVIRGQRLDGEKIDRIEGTAVDPTEETFNDRIDRTARVISTTIVRIGRAEITPQKAVENEIYVQLSTSDPEQLNFLKAGVQGIQIIHRLQKEPLAADRSQPTESEVNQKLHDVESNVVPFVLCPTIVQGTDNGREITVIDTQREDINERIIAVSVDLTVTLEQRVFLLLNATETSNTYILRAKRRTSNTHELTFSIQGVAAGTYLVRVQIDGAESPLTIVNDEYVGPMVTIP